MTAVEKRQPPRNALLSGLPHEELRAICSMMVRADLVPGSPLDGPEAPFEGIWFPEAGFVSVLWRDARDVVTEVAMVGREGAAGGFERTLDPSAFKCVAQQRGVAHVLPSDRISAAVERSPSLQGALTTAMVQLVDQAALTAHANARGRVIERLARWLLTAHDRIDADVVFITHDTLSTMLGVRRVGVTNALHILEGERFVRAYRGRVRIIDRPNLVAVANGLYRDTFADATSRRGSPATLQSEDAGAVHRAS